MIRTRLAAALTSVAIVSSAKAGFTFSVTDQGAANGYERLLIRAINDGVGTGTELDGYDLTFQVSGSTAHFNVLDSDFDGTPDTADLVNTGNPNAGFMRVGAFGTTSIVATTPALGPTQPSPWNAISTWSIAAISTGSETATGTGAIIARLFIPESLPHFSVTGQIGGNEGSAVPVNFSWPDGDPIEPPTVFVIPDSITLDVSTQTSFGPVTVSATDVDNNLASLTAGTVPAQIADNISITGSSTGPLTINGTGFTPADVGTYTINFTAMDTLGLTDVGTLTLNVVVPEPATLSLLTCLSILGLRRRK